MDTYLLTWNPMKWRWVDLPDRIGEIAKRGSTLSGWSCGNSKRIVKGDRVFLLRQGLEPRGICGSGRASSDVFEDAHWSEPKARKGGVTRYVEVEWEVLLDPETESIFPREWLNQAVLSEVYWNSQISGISIPAHVAEVLERRWSAFLEGKRRRVSLTDYVSPDEVEEAEGYFEGATRKVSVNVYERDPEARRRCLEHYGFDCYICDFSFERVYGEAGRDFIHVHHLKPLSEIGRKYKLDPVRDLRPICPNCHAVVHRRNPPYSVEEMLEMLHVDAK